MNSIHCSCNEKRGAGDIVMSERSIVTEADVDKEKLWWVWLWLGSDVFALKTNP